MTENPFKAPTDTGKPAGPLPGRRSMVPQVSIIAALMIVQGVLLLIITAVIIGYGFLLANLQNFVPPEEQEELMASLGPFVGVIIASFAIAGTGTFILAIMHFFAAYYGFQLKHRMFGMVTLVCGLASSLLFYCAPTAIGLCIYGLIVYLRPEVAHAFESRKNGMSKSDVLAQPFRANP